MLKKILFGLLGILLLLLIISFFLPSKMTVSQSATINASDSLVFAQVNDLRNWEKWSPWKAMDPEMKITYSDNPVGANGWYSWEGPQSGKGKLTIKSSTPNSNIKTGLAFEGMTPASGSWDFKREGDGVKVTWGFDSDMGMNPMNRWFGFLMKGTLEQQFQEGLTKMKTVCEQ